MTDVTSGAGSTYREFTQYFKKVCLPIIVSFCFVLYVQLCCLTLDWRILNTPFKLFVHIFHSRILHESLRWLIANNRTKQARIEVKKIAKINKVKLDDVLPLLESENEMTSLTESEQVPKENANEKKDNLFTVVRHKRLLKTSAIISFTW